VLAVAVLVCLNLGFAGTGGAVRAGTTDDPACLSNQAPIPLNEGPTTMLAHGATKFTASQVTGALGGGELTWSLKAQITGANTGALDGDLQGFLTATIDWDQPRPNTTFESDCVAGVHTRVGFLEFATYAGTVQNFPLNGSVTTSGPGQQAFSRIHLERIRPRVAHLDLRIDIGDECEFAEPFFTISRPEAQALGSKTGNGGRSVLCPS